MRKGFPCSLPPGWIVFSSSCNASWSRISEELRQALTLQAVWQKLDRGSSCSKAGLILTAFSELQLLRAGLLQCRTFLFRWDFKLQKKQKEYFEMWRERLWAAYCKLGFLLHFLLILIIKMMKRKPRLPKPRMRGLKVKGCTGSGPNFEQRCPW